MDQPNHMWVLCHVTEPRSSKVGLYLEDTDVERGITVLYGRSDSD